MDPPRTFLKRRATTGRRAPRWCGPALALCSTHCASVAHDTTPAGAVEAYAQALRQGDGRTAHALLSEAYRERFDAERFAEQVERYDRETDAMVQALSSDTLTVHETAHVTLVNGTEVTLVREARGRWRIASPTALYYDQSTPRNALLAFVRAMRNERWEALLRLMPERARGDLTAEELGENLIAQRHETERMLALLEASLDAPIEEIGDRATMPYGDRFAVRFVREGSLWKIEDPE